MLVEYFGHSCFRLTGASGVQVLFDPYDPGVGYRPPMRGAHLTLISHDHADHAHAEAVVGPTVVVRGGGSRDPLGIPVQGFLAHHDQEQGARLGHVTLFRVELDGFSVLHLSDLGHPLDESLLARLGPIDLLLVPCGGGGYTLGPTEAARVVRQIQPRWATPMHYRTPFLDRVRFPDLETVGPFLEAFGASPSREGVARLERSEGPTSILPLTHLF